MKHLHTILIGTAVAAATVVYPFMAHAQSGVTQVTVTETDNGITLSTDRVPAGPVEFVIKNAGHMEHELVVFKTSLSPDKLPMKGNDINEDSSKLDNVADTGEDNLKVGDTKTLMADLSAGNYVAVCNLPGHFMNGMKASFSVYGIHHSMVYP